MAREQGRFRFRVAFAVLGAVLAFVATAGVSSAEELSEDQILNALKPKKVTRSMSANPAETARNEENQRFIDAVRTKRTRSLSLGEREKVASIAAEKPSIDLEIKFDYNSARIGAQAVPAVTKLGKALTSPDLNGSVFLVAGHTDAAGGEAYNQELSDKRAEAVRNYLVEKFRVKPENLVAVGYGKAQLKDKNNPMAEENRRVQVVNMK